MLKARDFRHSAWNKLSQTNSWMYMVVITLIYEVIMGACAGLSRYYIGEIAMLLLQGPLTLGFVIAALDVSRGRQAKIETLFAGFKNFGKAFLLSLLNGLFIFLWSLLFIIPGIIKTYAYSMSTYILADNPDIDVNEARKRSIQMMKGNKWRLFCLHCSFIGWLILCILTLGILTFWVTPYMQVAVSEFYHDVSGIDANAVNSDQTVNNGFTPNGGSAFGAEYSQHSENSAQPDAQPAETTSDIKPEEESKNVDDGMFGYADKPVNLDDLDDDKKE